MLIDRLSFLTSWLGAMIPSFKKQPEQKIQWRDPSDRTQQQDIQLAACLMAAEGWHEAQEVMQGDWAWTPALEATNQLYADRMMIGNEALGYAYAYACEMQNSARDIRKIDPSILLERAAEDLGWNNNLRFIRCPECSARLFAYRYDKKPFGGRVRCMDCEWTIFKGAENDLSPDRLKVVQRDPT